MNLSCLTKAKLVMLEVPQHYKYEKRGTRGKRCRCVAVQLVLQKDLCEHRGHVCELEWAGRQTRGCAGRETVCTSADGTVRNPKLSINILTCTHFITGTAKLGLWLQQDPYIKIIGSQQRLTENIFYFTLTQGSSCFKSWRRETQTWPWLPIPKGCINLYKNLSA